MSAIVVLTPALTAAWPTISATVLGAATTLGFSSVPKTRTRRAQGACVDVEVPGGDQVAAELSADEELAFVRDDVTVVFARDARGRSRVKVLGEGREVSELERLGREFAETVVQQYAYHRLVEELGAQGFEIVGQEVGEDRTIHVQVRRYVG